MPTGPLSALGHASATLPVSLFLPEPSPERWLVEVLVKLLLATTNQGKLKEYRELLQQAATLNAPDTTLPPQLELVEPAQIGLHVDIEETGQTFEENALIKAKAFAAASGLYALADDSGLEIDALNGEPGVRSARYSGPTDADRIQAVLAKLKGTAPAARKAHFRCVVAIASPSGKTWTSQGSCDGRIATVARGHQGFGYDPIFYLPSLRRTMAQIPPSTKNRISHRAIAFRNIYPVLMKLVASHSRP